MQYFNRSHEPPNLMTTDFKPDVLQHLALIKSKIAANPAAAEALLESMMNDLKTSVVVITIERNKPAYSLPEYDPATDGDYSDWAARNNID